MFTLGAAMAMRCTFLLSWTQMRVHDSTRVVYMYDVGPRVWTNASLRNRSVHFVLIEPKPRIPTAMDLY